MTKLTDKSYISIGLMLALGTSLLGGGVLAGQVKTNSEEITKLRFQNEKTQEQYTIILVALAEIKTELQKRKK